MRMRGDMAMREHLGVQSIGRCQAPDVLRRLLDDTLCARPCPWEREPQQPATSPVAAVAARDGGGGGRG